MTAPEQLCSAQSLLRGEPMLGTAFPSARVLLVEQPGPWGREGLRASRLDAAVAEELERRAGAAGIRVLAIRRPGPAEPVRTRRWALADCTDGRESLRWGSFAADADLLTLSLDGTEGTPSDEPVILVCTNAKRDRCCALFGRPLATALHELRPGQVWESSHLGGHRFAATSLVLPAGLMYGRVPLDQAAEFLGAVDRDEVLGGLLRGRVGLPPAAQAALAFAFDKLGQTRRTALRVEDVATDEAGQTRVRIAGPDGPVVVTVRVEAVPTAGLSCDKPGPAEYLRYEPLSLDAAG